MNAYYILRSYNRLWDTFKRKKRKISEGPLKESNVTVPFADGETKG